MKTGIQVSSFKPVLTTPAEVETAFARMEHMGCEIVQLQWIHQSVPSAFVQMAMEKNGIRSVSVQDYYTAVRENPLYYTRQNLLTGGTWVCVSRIPDHLKSPSGLDQYVRELRTLASRLECAEQKLCFHPVSSDFAPIDGIDPVAYILDAFPELEICADLYHLEKSGKNMNAWLKQYAGRVVMVHFKDSVFHPDGTEELVPAGRGHIDWTGVVRTCVETGVEYAFVEQERWQGDPFHRLEEALRWLNGELKQV